MITRLKELRLAKGLTQTQVGEALGIHQRAYSYYESGERDIPNIILVRIADYFSVSIDYILFRTDVV
jgi:transcriptional regulator with XRE-family HTH domain